MPAARRAALVGHLGGTQVSPGRHCEPFAAFALPVGMLLGLDAE